MVRDHRVKSNETNPMNLAMDHIIKTDQFPLHERGGRAYANLVERCQGDLRANGMFNLDGFMRPEALAAAITAIKPVMQSASFLHSRRHNIYFKKQVPGLPPDHPALQEFETSNHTLCADQLGENPVIQLYEWAPLAQFLADVMEKHTLHCMADPLARVNVMAYYEGQTLNWHFDRSEFTTTLLLQAPEKGGAFEYRTDLRSAKDPNYDGVADLLAGRDPHKKSIRPIPGTLNVFKGFNTPHRVTTVEGPRERLIAVFSYYENPQVRFTAQEQIGFYGRTA